MQNNYVTHLERLMLITLAKQVKLREFIVEIGVLDGHTSELLCVANSKVQVIGIDPLIQDSMKPELIGDRLNVLSLEARYLNYTFIEDYSYNVVKNYGVHPDIGLLFIDGDHTYEAVKQDFEDWYGYVKPGGYIAFHDAAPSSESKFRGWPGPVRLVEELLLHPGIVVHEVVDTLVVFKKL